jgi:uncharacterized protein YbaA (DUF1428 family)
LKLKADQTVVFSWIVHESGRDRDRTNKLVFSDPRLADLMDPKKMPFDGKRMLFGGFKVLVEA